MSNESNNKTPKWLRRLEKESWQAELLISGLALYGTLQLPIFVYWLSDTLINLFPINYYLAGYAIAFLYLFGIALLTTFFIMHFILRAYWVGLIGLNSVYPDGYKIDNKIYSPIYSKLVAEKLPKVRDSIKEIDNMCSSMFSGAFVFLLMYGMMSISLSVILAIYMLTKDFIPFAVWISLGAVFFIAMIVVTIFGAMGKSEKFRNNEKLQKNFFRLSYLFGMIATPFVYKPINQILFTTTTNSKSVSANLKVAVPFFLIAMVLSTYHISQTNIGMMILKGNGENINLHENTVYADHYLDQYNPDQNIFVPVIDSDIVEGPFVKLFVPILKNESYLHEDICGEYEKDESLNKDAQSVLRNQWRLDCYKSYISIKVNGASYDADLMKHRNPQGDRNGVLCYIPTSMLAQGKNKVGVEKIKNKEGETYDKYTINFWYAPNK